MNLRIIFPPPEGCLSLCIYILLCATHIHIYKFSTRDFFFFSFLQNRISRISSPPCNRGKLPLCGIGGLHRPIYEPRKWFPFAMFNHQICHSISFVHVLLIRTCHVTFLILSAPISTSRRQISPKKIKMLFFPQ